MTNNNKPLSNGAQASQAATPYQHQQDNHSDFLPINIFPCRQPLLFQSNIVGSCVTLSGARLMLKKE